MSRLVKRKRYSGVHPRVATLIQPSFQKAIKYNTICNRKCTATPSPPHLHGARSPQPHEGPNRCVSLPHPLHLFCLWKPMTNVIKVSMRLRVILKNVYFVSKQLSGKKLSSFLLLQHFLCHSNIPSNSPLFETLKCFVKKAHHGG